MNRKIVSLLLSAVLLLSTIPSMAEVTVPPSVALPSVNSTDNLPSLDSFIGEITPPPTNGGSDTGSGSTPSTGGDTTNTGSTPSTGGTTGSLGENGDKLAQATKPKEVAAILEDAADMVDKASVKEVQDYMLSTLKKVTLPVDQEDKRAVKNAVAALVTKAIEKVGTLSLNVMSGAGFEVSQADLMKQVKAVSDFTDTLKAIQATTLDKKIESKVTLDLGTGKGSKLQLPPLDAVFEKVSIVEIKTGMGSILLSKNSFSSTQLNTTVEMNLAQVDKVPAALKGTTVVEMSMHQEDKVLTKFVEPITVSLPYTLGVGENPDQITAFYLDENGISHAVAGIYKEGVFTFKTNHFSMFYVKANHVSFTDVETTRWSKVYVDSVTAKGLMVGKGGERFDPTGDVTRAEFLVMLSSVLRYGQTNVNLPFSDVKAADWYYEGVAMLYNVGIIDAYSDPLMPNQAINREEMGVLIGKTLVYLGYVKSDVAALNVFADAKKISAVDAPWVATAVEQGILAGAYGLYEANKLMSREQATAVLYNMINK